MTVFLSRSAWGASPANRESPLRAETSIVFVHHSATAKPATIEEAKAQIASIQNDHLHRPISPTNPTLWADIAYNIVIGPGVILEGRGWDARGGGTGPGNKVAHHSGSWDNVSVSICVLGSFHPPINDTLDEATRATLVAALAEARARYGDALAIMGDRDVNSTACCGDNLYPLLTELWVQSSLEENDNMPTPKEMWDYELTKDGVTAPMWQWMFWIKDEVTRPDLLAKRIIDGIPRAQAQAAGLTYDDVLRAIEQVLKKHAAIISSA